MATPNPESKVGAAQEAVSQSRICLSVCLSVCQAVNKEFLKFSPCLFPFASSSDPNTEQSRPCPPKFELESLCSELWVVLPIQASFFPVLMVVGRWF